MKIIVTNNSKIIRILESKLNKNIIRICEGIDEDRIYFADNTFAYCIIEFILGINIKVSVTLLSESFDFVNKIEFDY